MKVAAIPENAFELILALCGAVPTPLLDTFQSIVRARAIIVGTKVGIFEVLRDGPLIAAEVARRLRINPAATEAMLDSLVGPGYLRFANRHYRLTRGARKWLLADSPSSLRDNMLHRFLEWRALEHAEEFVRTGTPLNVHDQLSAEEYGIYQRGMRSLAGVSAGEVSRRLPVRAGARDMLDIGGSHGYYSVRLCRRHPDLRATILDLPRAIPSARPLLEKEGMGDRIVYRAEDVLEADLGVERWDLVLVSQLVHHFDEETNVALLARIARSLRTNGTMAILEILRPDSPGRAGQTGAVLNFFFALTSLSGCWSLREITDWQRRAGLLPRKPIYLRSIPGAAIQSAVKSQ